MKYYDCNCNSCKGVIKMRYGGDEVKVGDLIEYVKDDHGNMGSKNGARAVVIEIRGNYMFIKWTDKNGEGLRGHQMDGSYKSEYFRLIERGWRND